MSKKQTSEVGLRPAVSDPPFVPVGLFDAFSRRVTTPTGDLVPELRPISRSSAAVRGLSGPHNAETGTTVEAIPFRPRHESPEHRKARGPVPLHVALKKTQTAAAFSAPAADIARWASEAQEVTRSLLHSRSESRASVARSVSRAASRGGGTFVPFPALDLFDAPDDAPQLAVNMPHRRGCTPPALALPLLIQTDDSMADIAPSVTASALPPQATAAVSPSRAATPVIIDAAEWSRRRQLQSGPPYAPPKLMKEYFLKPHGHCQTFLYFPWAAVCISNETDQNLATRAAVLCAATLELKRQLDDGCTVTLPYANGTPIEPCHAQCFAESLNGTLIVTDNRGSAAQRYVESSRHIVVSYGQAFFEVSVTDSAGRYLVASELYSVFESILRNERPAPEGVPIGRASRLPRVSWGRLQSEMKAACLANERTLSMLTRALFAVVLADPSMEPPNRAGPVLGLDGESTTAQWVPSAATLVIYPSGDAVMRTSALFCSAASLVPCAAWIAHAAATDSLLSPPSVPARVVQSVARGLNRSPQPVLGDNPSTSPVAGGKRSGRAVASTPKEQVPPRPTLVPITIPPPSVDPCPHRATVWMPEGFTFDASAILSSPERTAVPLFSFEVTAKSASELELAILIAVDKLDIGQRSVCSTPHRNIPSSTSNGTRALPTLYSLALPQPCTMDVRLCRNERIDNALAHFAELREAAPRCGPLRADIVAACIDACIALRGIRDRPPFVSLSDAVGLPAPSAIVAEVPYHKSLSWSIETTRWPPEVPLFSYQALTTLRSSLRRRLGVLFRVTIVGDRFITEEDPARFVTARQLADAVVDSLQCISSQAQRNSTVIRS